MIKREALAKFFKSRMGIFLIGLAVFIIFNVVYAIFFYSQQCENPGCFLDSMRQCKRAVYFSDRQDYIFKYAIKGEKEGECLINVKLVDAEPGEFNLDKFIGYKMDCLYPLGSVAYPESDAERCTGRLKEEISGTILEKYNTNILDNIDKIKEALSGMQ